MNAEQLSHEIIRLVYHEAVVSDDPYVQEVAVQTSVQDLLEEFERDCSPDLQPELDAANREVDSLREDLAAAESTIEKLNQDLADALAIPVNGKE